MAGPVSGGDVPQDAGQGDGPPHEGDGVEQGNTNHVEPEVDQGYLQRLHSNLNILCPGALHYAPYSFS